MKLAKFLPILILLLSIGPVSCKNATTKDLIVNKWKLKEFTPNPELQIPDSLKKLMEADITIEFTSDNKYIQTGGGITQNGTYKVSEDGKHITYTTDGGKEIFVDSIIELTKDKFSIIEETGNKKIYNK
jgi:hypothetical protein